MDELIIKEFIQFVSDHYSNAAIAFCVVGIFVDKWMEIKFVNVPLGDIKHIGRLWISFPSRSFKHIQKIFFFIVLVMKH